MKNFRVVYQSSNASGKPAGSMYGALVTAETAKEACIKFKQKSKSHDGWGRRLHVVGASLAPEGYDGGENGAVFDPSAPEAWVWEKGTKWQSSK